MRTFPTIRPVLCRILATTALGAAVTGPAAAQTAPGQTVILDQITLQGQSQAGYAPRTSQSATKTSTPLEETPITVSVVTQQQMQDQAVKSVAQALRYSPGVAAEYRGTSNVADETYIRGFGYVPMLLDGLSVGGQGLQMDPWLLESVAAVKGPASLLYGQSNPGGLIDMQMKKADGNTGTRVGGIVGSHNRAGLRFDVARKQGENLSWRVVGHAEKADAQEKGLQTRRLTLAPSVRWTPTDATSLTVWGLYQREPDAGYRNFRQALGTTIPTKFGYIPGDFLVGDPDFEKSERTTHAAGYQLEHKLSDATTLRQKFLFAKGTWDQSTLVWGKMAKDQRHIGRSLTTTLDSTRQVNLDNQIEHRITFGGGEHVLLGGVDISYSRVHRTTSYGAGVTPIYWTKPGRDKAIITTPPRGHNETISRQRQTGIYLQDQARFGNLHVQAGLRYDWADNDINDLQNNRRMSYDSKALTGRVGMLYEMANGLSPYISYSTSFEPVTTAPPAGKDPFDPTQGKQLEIGVKWANSDGTMMVTASAYDLRQSNVLRSINGSRTDFEQVGEIRSRGVEIEAQGQITNQFSMLASLGYNNAHITKSNRQAEIGTHNDRVPERQASIWGKYDFDNGFDAALGVRYIGKSWARGDAFQVDDVTLFDAAFGYDLGALDSRYDGMRAQINITNLADKFYASSCASAGACWVGPERQITASLDYSW